jgi:hypothetical protein
MPTARSRSLSRVPKDMTNLVASNACDAPSLAMGGQGRWRWLRQLLAEQKLGCCWPHQSQTGKKPGCSGRRRTLPGLATVFALVLAIVPPSAGADSPEPVLRARGLKKAGSVYILDGESDILNKMTKVQPLYDQMAKSYAQLDSVFRAQAEYDALDLEYKLLTERLRNVQAEIDTHPPLSNNMLRQNWYDLLETEKQLRFQRNALDRELDLRWKSLVSESKREALLKEFEEQRQGFLKESRDLRALIDKVNERYSQLARDEVVKKAIEAIRGQTKTRVSLGPSPEFKRRSTRLKNAEKTYSPANLTPN